MKCSDLDLFREECKFPSDLAAARAIGMSERTWHRYTNERPNSILPFNYAMACAAAAIRLKPWSPSQKLEKVA